MQTEKKKTLTFKNPYEKEIKKWSDFKDDLVFGSTDVEFFFTHARNRWPVWAPRRPSIQRFVSYMSGTLVKHASKTYCLFVISKSQVLITKACLKTTTAGAKSKRTDKKGEDGCTVVSLLKRRSVKAAPKLKIHTIFSDKKKVLA